MQFIKNTPAKQFKNYSYDNRTSLISRVKPTPNCVLEYWMKFDRRSDYTSYLPDKKEMIIIDKYINDLPPLSRKIMKERLIGFYFINNFIGNGAADWVIDDNNNIYVYLIFNPIVFKKNLSEIFTLRDKSSFIQNDDSIKISIDCGTKYYGFMYILIHESVHVVDYVNNITPYVEPDMYKLQVKKVDNNDFTEDIWKKYKDTFIKYSFRKDLTFFGLENGPKKRLSEAENIYSEFAESHFVSLYSSLNWAEDIAETITFYHITKRLNQPYMINVSKNGKRIFSYEPMKSQKVNMRYKKIINTVESFY